MLPDIIEGYRQHAFLLLDLHEDPVLLAARIGNIDAAQHMLAGYALLIYQRLHGRNTLIKAFKLLHNALLRHLVQNCALYRDSFPDDGNEAILYTIPNTIIAVNHIINQRFILAANHCQSAYNTGQHLAVRGTIVLESFYDRILFIQFCRNSHRTETINKKVLHSRNKGRTS